MKKLLIAMMVLASVNGFAANKNQRGQDGSGGGGICVNDKCKTLAEAGLKLLPEDQERIVEYEVVEEVGKITGLAELPYTFPVTVIGKPGEVEFVSSIDPKTLKSFLDEYRDVLYENNYNLSKNVEIFAITVKSPKPKTYIIADKYDMLTTRGKALLLIHEQGLRDLGLGLKATLARDVAIVNLLKAVENGDPESFDKWTYAKTVWDNSDYRTSFLISTILKKTGPLPLYTLFSQADNYVNDDGTFLSKLSLRYDQILLNNKYHPRFSELISTGQYSFVKYPRRYIFTNYLDEQIKDKESGQFVVTGNSFSKFTEQFASLDKENIISIFSQCKDIHDDTVILYATNELFSKTRLAICSIKTAELQSAAHEHFIKKIGPYIYGEKLNISGKLTCSYKRDKKSNTYNLNCNLEK